MLFSSFSGNPPTRQRRRGFRIIVALLAILVTIGLALQYTNHRLLTESKTDTLWGMLVGIAVATALLEYFWGPSI